MEHSWEVAVIAHTLALIKTPLLPRRCRCRAAVAAAALYHDITEVITNVCPPIKYHSPAICCYKQIELQAEIELQNYCPMS